jgi:hypothetical protein
MSDNCWDRAGRGLDEGLTENKNGTNKESQQMRK